ncbi:hypothetical protein EUX98_g9571 [Antrodiella citrinella]|uniref:Amino acid transporter transmembrane domain-containing protein n=1 Tax=Antrodiella citrinella TaxID=2447956 RepID=A0A4S4LSS1_9APHY|nr:hypothetical protein EUX98_g9571 [Antrodiella citrinella]
MSGNDFEKNPRPSDIASSTVPDNEKRPLAKEDVAVVSQAASSDDFDVYGNEDFADIQYRTMVWWKAAALMLAETVSLGILSLPSVFASIGMVAGCFLVVGLGFIATITGYVIGSFKLTLQCTSIVTLKVYHNLQ